MQVQTRQHLVLEVVYLETITILILQELEVASSIII